MDERVKRLRKWQQEQAGKPIELQSPPNRNMVDEAIRAYDDLVAYRELDILEAVEVERKEIREELEKLHDPQYDRETDMLMSWRNNLIRRCIDVVKARPATDTATIRREAAEAEREWIARYYEGLAEQDYEEGDNHSAHLAAQLADEIRAIPKNPETEGNK